MKITALKAQVKLADRVSVFVDGAYAFSLTLDQLLDQRIKKDDELTDADLARFKQLSADGKARARALEWCMNRPRSTREFLLYARRKQLDQTLADSLAQEFTAKKYLDDERYAVWLVELRARALKSDRAVRAELRANGIPEIIMQQVMSSTNSDKERLLAIAKKVATKPRYADRERLKRYLVGKGFSYSLVAEVVAELGLE
jgi:regulatory protein